MKIKKLIVATAISLGVSCSPAHASELTTLDVMVIKDDSRLVQTMTCNVFAGYAKVAQRNKVCFNTHTENKLKMEKQNGNGTLYRH